ncbi:MAG: DUF2236 domain-containing protein, partial [Acidobacteria bacterium]|nr:DUF2236 domain-containing protein [Acidobacteriota bacterium]
SPTSQHEEEALRGLRVRLERGLMLMPASANVVMQLSRRGVGRGVAESRVANGSLMKRPLKRLRTTLAYIWIALYGNDDERREMRRSVDAQHRRVRSRPDDDVAYDAFDTDLQMWVAACMFVGSLQGYEALYGPASEEETNELLAQCARFATTLQVPAAKWPRDRVAFDAYWLSATKRVQIDTVTGAYLRDFVDLAFLPRPVGVILRPLNRLMTGGFLAPVFREALGWSWSTRQQRRFDRVLLVARRLNRVLPGPLATFPWNLVRYDTRRRIARRRPLL